MLQAWVDGRSYTCHKRKNADLWLLVRQQLQLARPWLAGVVKVAARCDPQEQPTPAEEWAAQGNAAVDVAATRARDYLLPSLWPAWQQVFNHIEYTKWLAEGLHGMLAAVGKKALRAKTMEQETAHAGLRDQQLVPVQLDPGLVQLSSTSLENIPKQYRCEELQPLLALLHQLCNQDGQVRWTSFHQILLRYQKDTARVGPMPQKKHRGCTWQPGKHDDRYLHKTAVPGLQNYLTGLCKAAGHPLRIEQRRPPSRVLASWSGCITIPSGEDELDDLDTHLREHTCQLPVRRVRDQVPPFQR